MPLSRRDFLAAAAAAVPLRQYTPHALVIGRPDRMAWWREARFGLFLHWGLYSILAGTWQDDERWAEWIRNNAQIPVDQYDRLVERWRPDAFDPGQWADAAWRAGMRYVVLTTKHHDGFGLWPSRVGGFNVTATPTPRDIVGDLDKAFRRRGFRVGWYHSIMDWHHPDYLPRRDWEKESRPADGADYARYVAYLHAQVEELLTRYRPDVLWFDGEWEATWTQEHAVALRAMIDRIAPDCLVNDRINGSGGRGNARLGDFGTPEQEIPATGMPGRDWESCLTTNGNWGYKQQDHDWKSPRLLAELLVETVSKGGNLLLNVGPMADGRWPAEASANLEALGRWMAVHGDLVRGSTASRFGYAGRFRSTTQGDRAHLFVRDWQPGPLLLDGLRTMPRRALLRDADGRTTPLPVESWTDGPAILLPDAPEPSLLPCITLEFGGPWEVRG